MTVASHLSIVASALVLSTAERSSITTSISTLSNRLDNYFGTAITGHFQFGSSTRETFLPRKADAHSDVDYMIIFNTVDEGQKKPQTYLDRLRRFAEQRYASSEIAQSSPTIVLSLNHIRFELVPAIYNFGYFIPSPSSFWVDWMSTDPSGTTSALNNKNAAENFQIKPLVRLIKYWNATHGYPFNSFDIEQFIVRQLFFGCSGLKDYFYTFWTTVGYEYSATQTVKDKVDSAKHHAALARAYEAAGDPARAESEVRKIVPQL